MTESDIYQIIGKAYCDGYQEGLAKQASFEKQALNPTTLLKVLNRAASKGNIVNTMKMTGRMGPRQRGAVEALNKANASGALNPAQQSSVNALLKDWDALGTRSDNLSTLINQTMKSQATSTVPFRAGSDAASKLREPYYNSIISSLLKL